MRENIADSILGRMNKRMTGVTQLLSTQYKGVKPFDSQEVKPEDQLYWYDQLGSADMDYLIEKYGRDAVNTFVYENELTRQRRSKNVKPSKI